MFSRMVVSLLFAVPILSFSSIPESQAQYNYGAYYECSAVGRNSYNMQVTAYGGGDSNYAARQAALSNCRTAGLTMCYVTSCQAYGGEY